MGGFDCPAFLLIESFMEELLMARQLSPAVEEIVEQYLTTGGYSSSDDVLLDALAALRQRDEDTAAIAEGLAAMEAGEVFPLDQVADEIRRRHGFNYGTPRDS
jgi:predicted transcriptional regulator